MGVRLAIISIWTIRVLVISMLIIRMLVVRVLVVRVLVVRILLARPPLYGTRARPRARVERGIPDLSHPPLTICAT